MDPLSIAASIGGLTSVFLKIAKNISDVIGKFKGAPQTLQAIQTEAKSITFSLSQLQSLILNDEDSLPCQVLLNPEVLSVLDVALTGCTVTLSCIEDEIRSLGAKLEEDQQIGFGGKAAMVWRDDQLKDLLQQLRGQYAAIGLVLHGLQMRSLQDIQNSLRQNQATIDRIADRTQSLRAMYSRLKFTNSIFEAYSEVDSAFGDIPRLESIIGERTFEFDDIVVNSQAYRRALVAATQDSARRKNKPVLGDADLLDLDLVLVDLDGHDEVMKDVSDGGWKPSKDLDLLLTPITEEEAKNLDQGCLEPASALVPESSPESRNIAPRLSAPKLPVSPQLKSMTKVAFLDPSINLEGQSRDTKQTSYILPEDGSLVVTKTKRGKKSGERDTIDTSLSMEYFEGGKDSPSVRVKARASLEARILSYNEHIHITERKETRESSYRKRRQLSKKKDKPLDDENGDHSATEEPNFISYEARSRSVLNTSREHIELEFVPSSELALQGTKGKTVADAEASVSARSNIAELVTVPGTSVATVDRNDTGSAQAELPATKITSSAGKKQTHDSVQEEINTWADNTAKNGLMTSIQGEIRTCGQNAAGDKHLPPVQAVASKVLTYEKKGKKDSKATACNPGASPFPYCYERWETLSAHWEGITSFWIRRLQEDSDRIAQDDLKTQLSRQVSDLSAAGSNLFRAVVELQRLRASSERKFQRWFFETRAELERSQEKIAELENSLEESRLELKNIVESSREDLRELQVARSEALRAREEIERNAIMEKRRADRLEGGSSIEIGDMIVVPRFREREDGTHVLRPSSLRKFKKPKLPRGWEARWVDEERQWSYINQETNETQRIRPRLSDSRPTNIRRDAAAGPRSGVAPLLNTKGSSINDPKLLETIDDAIRRLILPELKALEREQSRQELKEQAANEEKEEADVAFWPRDRQPETVTDTRRKNITVLHAAVHRVQTMTNNLEISHDASHDQQERPKWRRSISDMADTLEESYEDRHLRAAVLPMPFMDGTNDSGFTRSSILSAETETPYFECDIRERISEVDVLKNKLSGGKLKERVAGQQVWWGLSLLRQPLEIAKGEQTGKRRLAAEQNEKVPGADAET